MVRSLLTLLIPLTLAAADGRPVKVGYAPAVGPATAPVSAAFPGAKVTVVKGGVGASKTVVVETPAMLPWQCRSHHGKHPQHS